MMMTVIRNNYVHFICTYCGAIRAFVGDNREKNAKEYRLSHLKSCEQYKKAGE